MQGFFKGYIYFVLQVEMRLATHYSVTEFWLWFGFFPYSLLLSCFERHLFLVLEAKTGFVSLPVVSDSYLKLLYCCGAVNIQTSVGCLGL